MLHVSDSVRIDIAKKVYFNRDLKAHELFFLSTKAPSVLVSQTDGFCD